MAESKRMFRKGNMNRDLDDRLVSPETYRYANNIKVGSSEGGDMGAIENLKGNEKLSGQEQISGTTIGSVKDPNSSKVYFFNTSEDKDAIYEYDDVTGDISTILIDNPSGELKKPSCRPTLSTTITGPDSDDRIKPDLENFPSPPTTGCGLSSSTHTSSNGLFYPSSAEVRNDSLCSVIATYGCGLSSSTHTSSNGLYYPATANTRNDSLCVAIPGGGDPDVITYPVARITGDTTATVGDNVSLDSANSTPGSLNGTDRTITSRAWFVDSTQVGTGTTYTLPGSGRTDGETETVTLTITNSAGDNNTDTHVVTFSAAAPNPVTLTIVHSNGGLSNTTANAGVTYTGNDVAGVVVDFNGTLSVGSGYMWNSLPTASLSSGGNGLTFDGLVNSSAGSTETLRTTLTGTYTGGTATKTITWSGSSPVVAAANCPANPAAFSNSGGSVQLSLTGYSSAPSVAESASWLTPSNITSTSLTLTATSNSSTSGRSTSITLSGGGSPSGTSCSFSVSQAGTPCPSYPAACNNYNCLVEGTLILLPDGSEVAIETLSVGDQIYSVDINGLALNQTRDEEFAWTSENLITTPNPTTVVQIVPSEVTELISINNGLLDATWYHLQMVKRNGLWRIMEFRDIDLNDKLIDKDGNIVNVDTIETIARNATVYKLDVEARDVYYANNILTHNK